MSPAKRLVKEGLACVTPAPTYSHFEKKEALGVRHRLPNQDLGNNTVFRQLDWKSKVGTDGVWNLAGLGGWEWCCGGVKYQDGRTSGDQAVRGVRRGARGLGWAAWS